MSRLQKKCFIAASGFHLLLVVILLVGPAFLAAHSRKTEEKTIQIIDVIPGKLIDEAFSGGGTPNATPPPPAPAATPPAATPPAATPPPPTPQPQPVVKPIPPQPQPVEPVKKTDIDPLAINKTSKPPTTKPKDTGINLTKVTRTAKDIAKNTSKTPATDPAAAARAQQLALATARKNAIGRSLRNLESNLSTGVDVSIPGPGGAAYANYGDALASVYYHAWILPDEASDDNASVKVKVTLARDGSIISARIVERSGNAALDRSVERVLNRVQSFEPFPEGATDKTRTFNFEFQPKFRKLIG